MQRSEEVEIRPFGLVILAVGGLAAAFFFLMVVFGLPFIGALFWVAVGAVAITVGRAKLRAERQRQIEWQQYQAIQAIRSREIGTYHLMNPREFEHALAYLCERDGCLGVQVVGGAGDLGADVIATAPDGRRIVIQAKRYGPTTVVSGPDLQKFGGTCYAVHGAQVAAVVTTSRFTKQAQQYAAHMGIRLWDNDALAGWASRTGPAPWH